MRGLLIENNYVVNTAIFDEFPDGWIAAPDGVGIGWTKNADGSFSPPALPAPDPLSPKEIRDRDLAALVHDFGDGRIIQCRPHPFPDESNMRNAIDQMSRLGLSDRTWCAADNTPVTVTAADLQTAIESGQDQSSAIWDVFFKALAG